MIFRLEYCNKASVTARVDIQKGDATPIYTVEGTSEPFVLFYNNDKGDKSGSFRSSGADINIYETTEFNIDELKTSNETEISVKYYINNTLNWSGFVIPDFFSETITGGKGVVSMVASDRLGTLKGATLSGLTEKVSNRALVEACLARTGLSLPLYTMADFTGDGANIFNSEVLSQRMVDTKGRNVSCYDILSSILEETNSLIVQRNGAWYIVNKLQLEAGVGSLYSAPATSSAWAENTVSFDEVSVGARRTITPVAAAVGVYHEHGGGRLHPDNYDFSQNLTGWTPVGGFSAGIDNRSVKGYKIEGGVYVPDYEEETGKSHLMNSNPYQRNTNPIYLESAPISVPYSGSGAINIDFDINGIGPMVMPRAIMRVAIVAQKGSEILTLHHGGSFAPMPSINPPVFEKSFASGFTAGDFTAGADTQAMRVSGTLESSDLEGWNLRIRIYGSGTSNTVLINAASIVMSSSQEAPKGNIFKTTQGANYTKDHEIPTVLWGDYLTSGLNGYFYDYAIDDTSSLYRPTGELHSRWTAYGDPDTLPLLQHITRQKARMFSVAHDLLSADIATSTFDPLSIFVDCDSTRYVVVSARFDFLRSNVSVELEEIAYATNSKRDYIYSYFGDGEEGISSIGGISGGATSTGGGGMTSEQLEMLTNLADWWKLDEENDAIYSEKSVYSLKGVSALGLGSEGGGGGGGSVDMLDSWANYTPAKANFYVPASLLVPFRADTLSRLTSLESGSATSIVTTGSGNAITSLTKSGSVITATKGLSFALSSHTHTIAQITGLQTALNSKQATLTQGSNITITGSTISAVDTTYGVATTSANGLMSSTDKSKLNGIATGANNYVHPSAHPISFITGLQGALDLKAPLSNPTFTGNVTGGIVTNNGIEYLNTLATTIGATGWYRVFVSNTSNVHGSSVILNVNRNYANTSNESYTFSINVAYSGAISITQLSGRANHRGIPKIRVDRVNSGVLAVDIYYNLTVANIVYISGSGTGKFQAPALVAAPTGTVLEFDTVDGVKSNLDLTASGGVNTPKVDFGNGFTIEPSGTELVFKYNGVIRQRMLSTGTILAVGGVTALATN